jgi:cyclophilin family peptidyl-prolyl cis-trans isomerase
VPSEKRARQRAYRNQKRAIEEQRRRRRRTARGLGSMGIGLVIVVGLIVLFVELSSGSGTPKKTATKATTTTIANVSTTTAAKVAATPCPPVTGSAKRVTVFSEAPPTCISPSATYDATVVTNAGTFVIEMPASASPAAVNNFVYLARYRFFDNTTFPRVMPGFVIQGGSPDDNITSGPGYSWTGNLPPASCTADKDCYPNYSVAMANSNGPSTNGSQFFIVLPGGGSQLTRNYTRFGQVVSGTSVVAKIGAGGNPDPSDNGMPPKITYHIIDVTITQTSGTQTSGTQTSGTQTSGTAPSSGAVTSISAPTTTAPASSTTAPASSTTAPASSTTTAKS